MLFIDLQFFRIIQQSIEDLNINPKYNTKVIKYETMKVKVQLRKVGWWEGEERGVNSIISPCCKVGNQNCQELLKQEVKIPVYCVKL